MSKRDHLRRLPPEHYRGDAIVHWSWAMRDRREGWLSATFYYRFRELLTHTAFRYGIACPIFCLMPDHLHMVWMGLFESSDQRLAIRHFSKSCNESLNRIGFELQDQPYDHVFTEDERKDQEFQNTCMYIARNPERAGLVEIDGYSKYRFSGCLVPGYPQLRLFTDGFGDEFDRIISYLKREGMCR